MVNRISTFSIKRDISAPENVVNLKKTLPVAVFSIFKYSCRFGRLHRSCLINRGVIMVLTLLFGTTNEMIQIQFYFGISDPYISR